MKTLLLILFPVLLFAQANETTADNIL